MLKKISGNCGIWSQSMKTVFSCDRRRTHQPGLQAFELDQAATVFPATLSRRQHHIFNLYACLSQPVDGPCLQQALENCRARFPALTARLVGGFWRYRLQSLEQAPKIGEGIQNRLRPMSRRELSQCCFRVEYQNCSVSMDFFHALTDGCGAMVFFKALLAEYHRLRYGLSIPAGENMPVCHQLPIPGESEDGFLRYAKGKTRSEPFLHAYKHRGKGAGELVTQRLWMDSDRVHTRAGEYGVTVTEYLLALVLAAMDRVRAQDGSARKKYPVRIAIPVNLRQHFSSSTLRNFSLCCMVSAPIGGSVREICGEVHEQLLQQNTPGNLADLMTTFARMIRLAQFWIPFQPLRNVAFKIVYGLLGSHGVTMAVSSLGRVELPAALEKQVTDLAFYTDTNACDTHNCTLCSYRGRLSMVLCRWVADGCLEENLARMLGEEGLFFQQEEIRFPL